MIGRAITIALCAGAFWLGMQFQTMRTATACIAASGSVAPSGLCIGARP